MSLGSCFTENIGSFLTKSKFSSLINPFGIIYNPISICTILHRILDNTEISASELVKINGRFFHWDFHGDLSSEDLDQTINLLNNRIQSAHQFIKKTDVLFLTLGTSNAFQLIEQNRIVANCHKYPNDKFNRIELSVEEMGKELQKIIERLQQVDPNLKIVFTVSPVRHIRDGLINNQWSKARLLNTIHHVTRKNECVNYFPSYELVMDDLRDYRFYSSDMLHINEQGQAYIWDYFKRSFFTDETTTKIDQIMKIHKDLGHKAFYPTSDKHQTFLKNLEEKIEQLINKDPQLDFSQEKKLIKKQMIT